MLASPADGGADRAEVGTLPIIRSSEYVGLPGESAGGAAEMTELLAASSVIFITNSIVPSRALVEVKAEASVVNHHVISRHLFFADAD